MIYQGNSNSRDARFSEAFLLRSGSAAPVYDPNEHYCFGDNEEYDHYCWYYTDSLPEGNWNKIDSPSAGGCGELCVWGSVYLRV